MKTRIVHTKIWEDTFFRGLGKDARYLFFYLLTNYRINLCGVYELSEEIIVFETGLKKGELEKAKKQLSPKVKFFKNWVYVVNAKRLGGYSGKLCDQGIAKEMKELPEEVKKCFIEGKCDTPCKGYVYPLQGTRNKKQEIINKKQEIKVEKKLEFLKKIPPDVLSEFTTKFKCSNAQVIEKGEKLHDYCKLKGRDNGYYKNYKIFLKNAVEKDFGKRPAEKEKPVWQRAKKELTPEQKKKIESMKQEIRGRLKIKK